MAATAAATAAARATAPHAAHPGPTTQQAHLQQVMRQYLGDVWWRRPDLDAGSYAQFASLLLVTPLTHVHAAWGHAFFCKMGPASPANFTVKVNSVNAGYFLYTAQQAAQPLVCVKVMLPKASSTADPMSGDAICGAALEALLQPQGGPPHPAAASFMRFHGTFEMQTSGATPTPLTVLNPVFRASDEGEYVHVCAVGGIVGVSLMTWMSLLPVHAAQIQDVQTGLAAAAAGASVPPAVLTPDDRLELLLPALARLFVDMYEVGEAVGFTHNDAHGNNVMFDMIANRLVLIDYGRATLCRTRARVVPNIDAIVGKQGELTLEDLSVIGSWDDWWGHTTGLPFRFGVADPAETPVLNDIAAIVFGVLASLGGRQTIVAAVARDLVTLLMPIVMLMPKTVLLPPSVPRVYEAAQKLASDLLAVPQAQRSQAERLALILLPGAAWLSAWLGTCARLQNLASKPCADPMLPSDLLWYSARYLVGSGRGAAVFHAGQFMDVKRRWPDFQQDLQAAGSKVGVVNALLVRTTSGTLVIGGGGSSRSTSGRRSTAARSMSGRSARHATTAKAMQALLETCEKVYAKADDERLGVPLSAWRQSSSSASASKAAQLSSTRSSASKAGALADADTDARLFLEELEKRQNATGRKVASTTSASVPPPKPSRSNSRSNSRSRFASRVAHAAG
jgi:hypothetical protein